MKTKSRKKKRRLSPSYEDYIEAIYRIQQEKKVVRVKDISSMLDVSMPSVNGAINSLKEKGLVNHQKYGHVELTPEGKHLAREVFKRHKLIINFFTKILYIDREIAEEDACKIEHYLSKTTIDRLSKFIEFVESCPKKDTPTFLENFSYYYKHGKRKI